MNAVFRSGASVLVCCLIRWTNGGETRGCLISPIFPHFHISIGWISKAITYEKLDWEKIGAPNTLTLLDPLPVITEYGTPVELCDNQTARAFTSLINRSKV